MCVCIYLYLYVISASTSIHRDIMEDMLSPGSRDPQTGVYSGIPCFGILNGNGVFYHRQAMFLVSAGPLAI